MQKTLIHQELPPAFLKRICIDACLNRMASDRTYNQLSGVLAAQWIIESFQAMPLAFLEKAHRLVLSRNSTLRWQSLILAGLYINTHPKRVWSVVIDASNVSNTDLQQGIATVLVEHLIESAGSLSQTYITELVGTSHAFRLTLTYIHQAKYERETGQYLLDWPALTGQGNVLRWSI